jgi:hypothetical protein
MAQQRKTIAAVRKAPPLHATRAGLSKRRSRPAAPIAAHDERGRARTDTDVVAVLHVRAGR